MLEMLLQIQAQWKTEQRLEWERMAAERARITAKWDQWAAKRATRAERNIVGPRPIIYKYWTPYSTGAVQKSWTDFWMRYDWISTPTATSSHAVDPIMLNTRSLFWMPGVSTKTRYSGRQW